MTASCFKITTPWNSFKKVLATMERLARETRLPLNKEWKQLPDLFDPSERAPPSITKTPRHCF